MENDIDIEYAKQKHALVLNWYVFIVLFFTAHVYWKDLWLYEIQSDFKFYLYMYFMKTGKGASWQSDKGASWQSDKGTSWQLVKDPLWQLIKDPSWQSVIGTSWQSIKGAS